MSRHVRETDRFRLTRAGVLNVWQYDEQVFEFAEGRLLLRGANGAGKSKTLEMLLPFVLDGDKARMTASARHHTSLLWLMLDGYAGQNRAGYLWVEFARPAGRNGPGEAFTCGVGVRAAQSTRSAVSWYFTLPGRIGVDLELEDDAGPLARERLRAAVEERGGHFFDSPRAYKQHVGRTLFGLEQQQYDELLRLLYWLRQPQVGEDIEPARLAEQLVQALPQLDDEAIRTAGDTFDELAAFGEQLDRQRRCAEGVATFGRVYADYARAELRRRGTDLVTQHTERGRRAGELRRSQERLAEVATERAAAEQDRADVGHERATIEARLGELRADPLMRTAGELNRRRELATERQRAARLAEQAAGAARQRVERVGARVRADAAQLGEDLRAHTETAGRRTAELDRAGARSGLIVPRRAGRPPTGPGRRRRPAALRARPAPGSRWTAARPVLGELRAAVRVVEDALAGLGRAAGHRERAEEAAAGPNSRPRPNAGCLADARARPPRGPRWPSARPRSGGRRPGPSSSNCASSCPPKMVAAVATRARTAAEPALEDCGPSGPPLPPSGRAAERALVDAERRRAVSRGRGDPAPADAAWARRTGPR